MPISGALTAPRSSNMSSAASGHSQDSIYAFRDLVGHVFRLAFAARSGRHSESIHHFDRFLDSTVQLLESKESSERESNAISKETQEALNTAFLAHNVLDFMDSPPTLRIHPEEPRAMKHTDAADIATKTVEVKVTKAEPEVVEKPVTITPPNTVVSGVTVTKVSDDIAMLEEGDAVSEEETMEVEDEEGEAEEEVEEEEEAEAEEEAEEEGLEPIKIGKKYYFIEQSTQTVYARIDEETPGDCLGRLVNGKIVPN